MKVLLDSCVWGGSKLSVAAVGHDVVWAGDWPADPGDSDILSMAHREGRVLVTLDKDFGELAILHGHPHAGIVRLVGFRAREQGPILNTLLLRYGKELAAGAILTASPERVRVRPPEGKDT